MALLQPFLNMFTCNTLVSLLLFIIFFAFINYILSRVFRDRYANTNTATAGIISFCVAVLIIYFGQNLINNVCSGFNFPMIILYMAAAIAVVIFLIWARRRIRFCGIFMIIGAGLILIGALTDWFYQRWFVICFGILLLILGAWLCLRRRRNRPEDQGGGNQEQVLPPGRTARRRSLYDLKRQYMSYLFEYYRRGVGPQRQRRIRQAMETIIRMARRMGCSERRFLSRAIAGQSARSPRELR